jgi:N-acetylglucosaminyl-diphospho-decaprenol L-rhamnosyltransferase
MAISVIVSCFNGAKYLPKLLDSLKQQEGVELQIIVVDRNSTDGSAEMLARHPHVLTIREPPESGLVAGYAAGRVHARGDYLFFSNEDMWFDRRCLSLLRRQFDEDRRVAAVMPVQLSYDGSRVVQAGTWFTRAGWYRDNPHPFRASVFRDVKEPEPISGINAGACLISSKAYDEVGGWDTSFFLDYEDMDLSLRLWQHDWLCRIEPNALVYHDVGASNAKSIHGGRTTVGAKRYVGALANQVTIAMKTFTGLAPLAVPALLADRLMRDVLKFRWADARLDIDAIRLTLKRVPDVLEYRRKNRAFNHERPGQNFFSDPRFDVASPTHG